MVSTNVVIHFDLARSYYNILTMGYITKKALPRKGRRLFIYCIANTYLPNACEISTATATVTPTIGLLPIPRNPIIST